MTPGPDIHAKVSGAIERYGYVGSMFQYLLQDGEVAPTDCVSHESDIIREMVAAYEKDGEADWRTRPYREAGLEARDQTAYEMFGGHRMRKLGGMAGDNNGPAGHNGGAHDLGD